MAFLFFLIISFAIFAWFISWGMVAVLFYPKKPIQIIGFRYEAPFLQWAKSIQLEQLIPNDILPKQLDQLMPIIDDKLDDFFRNRLTQKLPMIAMFIGDKTIQQLKEVFIEELRVMFPNLMTSLSTNVQKELTETLDHIYLTLLQQKLLRATAPLRMISIIFGVITGVLTYCILSFF